MSRTPLILAAACGLLAGCAHPEEDPTTVELTSDLQLFVTRTSSAGWENGLLPWNFSRPQESVEALSPNESIRVSSPDGLITLGISRADHGFRASFTLRAERCTATVIDPSGETAQLPSPFVGFDRYLRSGDDRMEILLGGDCTGAMLLRSRA